MKLRWGVKSDYKHNSSVLLCLFHFYIVHSIQYRLKRICKSMYFFLFVLFHWNCCIYKIPLLLLFLIITIYKNQRKCQVCRCPQNICHSSRRASLCTYTPLSVDRSLWFHSRHVLCLGVELVLWRVKAAPGCSDRFPSFLLGRCQTTQAPLVIVCQSSRVVSAG